MSASAREFISRSAREDGEVQAFSIVQRHPEDKAMNGKGSPAAAELHFIFLFSIL
jgi:hypothetical protein